MAHRLILTFSLPQSCIIADCGEHKEGEDWGVAPSDGSGDVHPDFPEDSDVDFNDASLLISLYM